MNIASAKTLDLIFEKVSEGIFLVDKDSSFIKCNDAFLRIVLYDKKEIKTIKFSELFKLDISYINFFEKIKKQKELLISLKFINKINVADSIDLKISYNEVEDNLVFFVNNTFELISKTSKKIGKNFKILKESETKYKNIFKNIPLGIFTIFKDGTVESINPFMVKILGSPSKKKSVGFNINELKNLKNTELLKDIQTCFDKGEIFKKIYEYTSVWDKKIHFMAYIFPVNKKNRNKIMLIIDDKTNDKLTQDQLLILSEGVNNSPASIVVADKKGKIQFVNNKFIELTGYNIEEVIGKETNILKSGYHSKDFYNNLWETVKSGKQWIGEFYNKKKNGEYFWESAMISVLKNDKNDITNFMAIKEDITEKKKTEKKLQDRTEQLLSLVNHTPDVVVFKDSEGKWILANKIAINLFGLEKVNFYSKTDEDLKTYIPKHSAELENNIKTDALTWEKATMLRFDEIFYTKEGEEIVFDVLKLPLFNSDGSRKALITLGRNVTKRKKYEIELKFAKEKAEEADSLKSAFLANMSHEIRTPLNGIMGFSSLLQEYSLSKEDVSKFVDIIIANGNQLLTIIDDILLISKLQVNQIKVSDSQFLLNKTILNILEKYTKELKLVSGKDVNLRVELIDSYDNVKIETDKSKFSMIFSKLIRNAMKFTNSGEIVFGYNFDKKNEMYFFVKDTGVGISDDKKHIIFKKFRQVDDSTTRLYGGTGIGLSIVKGLVDLLNGKLWLESKINEGSTFLFKIPLIIHRGSEVKKEDAFLEARWTNKKVLIVDDVDESLLLLEEILIPTGIKIYKAKNGIEAVKAFIENQDIDIILMDIQLPEINGLEAAKRIKEIKNSVKIIAQTAFANQGFEQSCEKSKCDDFINKPIISSILFEKISNLLYV
ncbi:MAG: PAS domain S-box protein [Bacteroidales bacterium]|nr:PAS domain S-box protein [Bacteroidales bacterium]MBN2756458.1 PAS domain S-box protein [Bacteroidales bacterium]